MKHKFNDSVVVEFPVSARHATTLANWASVQRTISEAISLLNDYNADGDLDLADRVTECVLELEDIGPALDMVHQTMRDRLWQASKADGTGE